MLCSHNSNDCVPKLAAFSGTHCMKSALQNQGLVNCYILVWKTRLLHSGLEDTHFGIYTSDSELMDISNTSGRDLNALFYFHKRNKFFYITSSFSIVNEFPPKKKNREIKLCTTGYSMNSRISGLAHQYKVC